MYADTFEILRLRLVNSLVRDLLLVFGYFDISIVFEFIQ